MIGSFTPIFRCSLIAQHWHERAAWHKRATIMAMKAAIAYDLTRLLLRSFGTGPNGIDRVDLGLARHFLTGEGAQNCGLLLSPRGYAVITQRNAEAFLVVIEAAWREDLDLAEDQTFQSVRQRLLGSESHASGMRLRIVGAPASRTRTTLRLGSALAPSLLWPRRVPKNSLFLHATQFPTAASFRWLARRPDVKPIFFVHDMLPIQRPEFFTAEQVAEHQAFLEIFLRYARAAIVHSESVKKNLVAYLRSRSSGLEQILVASMPAASIFARAAPPDLELRARPYFVVCGTIEPRKNHWLLLKVWKELVQSEGAGAPKLVVIGRRGWKNEEVFDLLDRASWASSHVIEVAGLSTPGMKHLIANSRALLMPSFAEGYGLPIVEAKATCAPVIASDIAVFREIGGDGVTYCAANDAAAWLSAVRTHAAAGAQSSPGGKQAANQAAWKDYFRGIEDFISSL
jgi:glycosyltransferase involved in cell wall biosynthesis